MVIFHSFLYVYQRVVGNLEIGNFSINQLGLHPILGQVFGGVLKILRPRGHMPKRHQSSAQNETHPTFCENRLPRLPPKF